MTKQEKIQKLEQKIVEKQKTANYLAGKKRGGWGLCTMADEKRSDEIYRLKNRLNCLLI